MPRKAANSCTTAPVIGFCGSTRQLKHRAMALRAYVVDMMNKERFIEKFTSFLQPIKELFLFLLSFLDISRQLYLMIVWSFCSILVCWIIM